MKGVGGREKGDRWRPVAGADLDIGDRMEVGHGARLGRLERPVILTLRLVSGLRPS